MAVPLRRGGDRRAERVNPHPGAPPPRGHTGLLRVRVRPRRSPRWAFVRFSVQPHESLRASREANRAPAGTSRLPIRASELPRGCRAGRCSLRAPTRRGRPKHRAPSPRDRAPPPTSSSVGSSEKSERRALSAKPERPLADSARTVSPPRPSDGLPGMPASDRFRLPAAPAFFVH